MFWAANAIGVIYQSRKKARNIRADAPNDSRERRHHFRQDSNTYKIYRRWEGLPSSIKGTA